MNPPQQNSPSGDRLHYLFSTLNRYKALIIVPTVVCAVAAGAYLYLRSTTWTAKQSLVIRDDLVGQSYKPGRFDSLDAMKVAQESILEIARNPQVIRNAMVKLGPPESIFVNGDNNHWPNAKQIEETQEAISISAPNGNELGTTEIFLLAVRASTPDRACKFSELILDEIEKKAREVRRAKFGSIVHELQQKLTVAQTAFEKSAAQLNSLEKQIGTDLSAMRALTLEQGGDGVLDLNLMNISAEKRAARVKYEQAAQELELLTISRENPAKMLTTSSELLRMQPRLNDLVAGLSRAQLELARQISEFSRSENHPKVKSGRQGILNIQKQIYREIDASIESLNARVASLKSNFDRLQREEDNTRLRLTNIAELRVDYDKLVREVEKREEVLGQVRGELAQVQSASGNGERVNLLTRVDDPQVSTRPDGPSKRTILGAGTLSGLMIGMGLMMLVAPPYLAGGIAARPRGSGPANGLSDPDFSQLDLPRPGETFAGGATFDFDASYLSSTNLELPPWPNPMTSATGEPALNPVVIRPVVDDTKQPNPVHPGSPDRPWDNAGSKAATSPSSSRPVDIAKSVAAWEKLEDLPTHQSGDASGTSPRAGSSETGLDAEAAPWARPAGEPEETVEPAALRPSMPTVRDEQPTVTDLGDFELPAEAAEKFETGRRDRPEQPLDPSDDDFFRFLDEDEELPG